MKKNNISKFGFTMIELLVVITIIGVLTTIGVVSYQSANLKSRNSRRQADIEAIRQALEMCKADAVDGSYPLTSALSSCGSGVNLNCGTPATPYLRDIPCDPKTGSRYDYNRTSLTTYILTATLDPSGTYSKTNP